MALVLEDKVAIVTGAGSGIGEASALLFASEGAAVVVNDLDGDRATRTAQRIHEARGRAIACPGDVSKRDDVQSLVDSALSSLGGLDVMYNNAAFSIPGSVIEIGDDEWKRQQQVVLDSVFYGIQCASLVMRERGGGTILSTASGAGIGGEVGLGAYAANKAAVINLTQTAAQELARDGIRVNAITPGPTATPPLRAWVEGLPGGEAEFVRTAILGRLTRPEEVARIALFLASEASSAVTGHVISANYRVTSRRVCSERFVRRAAAAR
jgi:NAD(P)-dependent dehydrogenase (short-subunit alcohol dehydrogenase family)